MIAHRTSTIALADRVVLLEDGAIAAGGTHAELMATEPRYAEVLAHIEEVEAGRRERAAAAEAEAARLRDLRERDGGAPTGGAGFGDLG